VNSFFKRASWQVPKNRLIIMLSQNHPSKLKFYNNWLNEMLTIGLDVGTQGTKCLVYDVESKEIKGRGAVSYGLNSERHGQAEQDPAIWVQVRSALSHRNAFCYRLIKKDISSMIQDHRY
jgi:hypothetical protein